MQKQVCFTPSLPQQCSLLPRTGLRTICAHPSKSTRLEVQPKRRANITMGLFGLGLPELAVIAGVGIFIFGPSKVAEMGKELGGFAGGVKKATAEFREAMEESLEEADKEIERKKKEKEEAENSPAAQASQPSTTNVEPSAQRNEA